MLRNGDFYTFLTSCGNTILVPETQEIFTEELLPPAVNMEGTLKESRAENIGYINAINDNFGVEIIIKELNSFREFQAKIESKLDNLEELDIFTGNNKNSIENVNDNVDFVISFLKSRITSLARELSKKDGIEILPDQLALHSNSKSQTSINGDIEFKINKKIFASAITRVFLPTIQLKKDDDKGSLQKVKFIVVEDSHVNGINKKGLCGNMTSKSKTALDEIVTLVCQKPDRIIVRPGTNDITKGINILNTVKKIEKKIKNSLPNTRSVFSSLICQKTKQLSQKKYLMLMFRIALRQNSISFNDKQNITEDHLRTKNLH